MGSLLKEPMKSILDRSFKYTSSTSTDLRKTFAKALREQRLKRKQKDEQKQVVANIYSLKVGKCPLTSALQVKCQLIEASSD